MKAKVSLLLIAVFLLSVAVHANESSMHVTHETNGSGETSVHVEQNGKVFDHFSTNNGGTSVNVQSINGEDPKITITGISDDKLNNLKGLGARIRQRVNDDLNKSFASREAEFDNRIKEMKILFQKQRDEFKQKLQTFKDQNKKSIAENIDTGLQSANTNRTQMMTKALSRFTQILQNLQNKVNAAKAAGQDVSNAQTAIDSANKAIASAQAAVATQTGKSYTANVTDETKIKDAMKTVVTQFQSDIRSTEESVLAARKAVIEAAQAVYKLKVSNESNTATSAATSI